MPTIFDNMAEGIRAITNIATEKAGEITKAAASKAEELGKIGKLKMDAFQKQRELQKTFAELGECYHTWQAAGEKTAFSKKKETIELLKRVDDLRVIIQEKETAVTELTSKLNAAAKTAKPVSASEKPSRKSPAANKKKSAPASKKPSTTSTRAKRGEKKDSPKKTAK